jgi:proteasome alpha subunit
VAMQFYASPEQIMRDRSEYARKGIARGRSAVVLSYEGGVLFVAENISSALHKVSEIYDRIGFAAVGRYNEFENLRAAGVRLADLRGYSYDRRDVTGRALANAYAQGLGATFTDQTKPLEVEICVAEVGATTDDDALFRVTFDGSVQDEPGRLAMGGQAESVSAVLKDRHRPDLGLSEALHLAVDALASVGGEGSQPREIPSTQLEVAVLDRNKPGRSFRRIVGAALVALLERGTVDETSGPHDVPVSPAPAKKDDPAGPPSADKPKTDPAETGKAAETGKGAGKATPAAGTAPDAGKAPDASGPATPEDNGKDSA